MHIIAATIIIVIIATIIIVIITIITMMMAIIIAAAMIANNRENDRKTNSRSVILFVTKISRSRSYKDIKWANQTKIGLLTHLATTPHND